MSEPIKPNVSPSNLPASQGQTEREIERLEKNLPTVPVSSIKFSYSGKLKENAVPVAMQAKAASILTVKSLMLGGTLTQMQPALTGVGSLFMGINLPVGIINTYSLAKNWKDLSWSGRGVRSTEILSNTLLAGAGSALLLSKIPALAKLIGPAHAMTATKAAFVLGPLGMALFSVLNLRMGAVSTIDAVQAEKQRSEAQRQSEQADGPQKTLFQREEHRFSAMRDFSIAKAIRSVLLGIGVGLGALVMSGIVVGALATPFGWAAVGLIGAGLAVTIGTFVVRKVTWAEVKEKENALVELIINEELEVPEELLQTSIWHGKPTLQELIERKRG